MPAPTRASILIADDHPLFRSALGLYLAKLAPGAEVLEAQDFDSLASAARRPCDFVLLDLMMPGASGFSCLLHLRREHPASRVAIVSGVEQPLSVRAARALGAVAYIPKTLSPEQILEVLRGVLKGGTWFPAETEGAPATMDGQLAQRLDRLSPQELRVLLTLGEGRMNKQIAEVLGISEGTVKVHMKAILRKLEVATRTQAALIARAMLDSEQRFTS